MEEKIKEIEKNLEGLVDLINHLILKISKQDEQIMRTIALFNELINKKGKQ